MVDYQTLLYDPNYLIIGEEATINLPTGEVFTVTAVDKTSGIDVGNDVTGQTILPAAAVRMAELRDLGLSVERLTDANAKITINGFVWTVESYRMKPSPKGESDGEVYLLLSEKKTGKDAMTPGVYDFDLVRGSTSPFTFQLKTQDAADVEVNLPYDDVRLSIYSGGVLLFRKTLADASLAETAPSDAEITWTPTPEESRQIPLGPNTTYELEVRYTTSQQVYLMGTITGIGGGNDD